MYVHGNRNNADIQMRGQPGNNCFPFAAKIKAYYRSNVSNASGRLYGAPSPVDGKWDAVAVDRCFGTGHFSQKSLHENRRRAVGVGLKSKVQFAN